MIFVCERCGELNCFSVLGSKQVCSKCGNTREIQKGKLVMIIGPQGAGKTTILEMLQKQTNWVCFDGDLIRPHMVKLFGTERDNLKLWLKLCVETVQTVPIVVLCGNWTVKTVESCKELSYFSSVIVLRLLPSLSAALHVQQSRPKYRHVSRISAINNLYGCLDFYRYLLDEKRGYSIPVQIIKTQEGSQDRTAQIVIRHIDEFIKINNMT